jgi:TolB protein
MEIHAVKPDGTGLQVIKADSAWLTSPTVSPSGQKIALVRASAGVGTEHIYVMNADGTGFTQITFDGRGEGEPAWSPDGSTVAFTCNWAYTTIRDICTVNQYGGLRRTVVGGTGPQLNPSFSRDGNHIVYEDWTADPYARLFIAKADGTERMQVEPYLDLMANYNATWSR